MPKLGAIAILKKYTDVGYSGIDEVGSSRLYKIGDLERQVGPGRKRTRRTPGATEAAKAYFEDSKFAAPGGAPRDLRTPNANVRRLVSKVLDLRPLRRITTQGPRLKMSRRG